MNDRLTLMFCSEAVMKIREELLSKPTHSLVQISQGELLHTHTKPKLVNVKMTEGL